MKVAVGFIPRSELLAVRVAERRLNPLTEFRRRSATHAPRSCLNRGMNPTATVTSSLREKAADPLRQLSNSYIARNAPTVKMSG